MAQEPRPKAPVQIVVRHHYPEKADPDVLRLVQDLWASGLIRAYRRGRQGSRTDTGGRGTASEG